MNDERAIIAMAESIPAHVDLKDNVAVAIELILKGFRSADIGEHLPSIIERANIIREAEQ